MTDRREPAERTDRTEPAEPIEKADKNDPVEPIESTDPTEPIERNEPFEAIDSIELSDHSDRNEREPADFVISPSCFMSLGSCCGPPVGQVDHVVHDWQ